MNSFIYSLWPVVGYVSMLLLIIFIAWIYEYKKRRKKPSSGLKYFEMDEKPLTNQTLFWLAIAVPFFSFCYFGAFSWYGKPILFNADGFERFIKISTLPLGLLSLSIPFIAVINNIHRTIQTNKQIESASVKNNSDLYFSHRKNTIDYFNSMGVINSFFSITTTTQDGISNSKNKDITVKIKNSFKLYEKLFPYSKASNFSSNRSDRIISRVNKCWGMIDCILTGCENNAYEDRIIKLVKINRCLEIIERTYTIGNNFSSMWYRVNVDESYEFGISFQEQSELIARLKCTFEIALNISYIVGGQSSDISKYSNLDKFISKYNNTFLFISKRDIVKSRSGNKKSPYYKKTQK